MKYFKCIFFTLTIVLWLVIFEGFGAYFDLLFNKNLIRTIVVTVAACIFLLFFVRFLEKQIFKACLFRLSLKKQNVQYLWKCFLFICLAFALITAFAYFSKMNDLKENDSVTYHWLLLSLLYAFSISISEEILFRGLLAVYYRRYFGEVRAILFSAIIFTLVHLGYFEILPLITAFLFGILSAFLMFRCRSLYPSIGLHAGWDFSYFILNEYFQPVKIPVWGDLFEFYQIALLLIILLGVVYKKGYFKCKK